jgi:phospholipid/cholesterol/gamma-HCH transport system substrate-binding protein
VAGRFGIKESTGGVGGDLYLFDDKLELSADVFGFAQSTVGQNPRVKTSVGWEVWNKTLFLVAGADDLLNYHRGEAGTGGGFDWFVGGQLRFNDEDLKSLLLVGGGAAAGAASK